MQDLASSKTNSYEQCKPKEDMISSSSGGYTLRPQESTESYQDELLPVDDHNDEPESPRVLPEVPNSAGSVDMYPSPVKHFSPSISQQQQQESIEEHEDEEQLDQDDEEKELSAEDNRPPEQTAPEEKSNLARMRWHKAYNKIVHQLNVSTLFFLSSFLPIIVIADWSINLIEMDHLKLSGNDPQSAFVFKIYFE